MTNPILYRLARAFPEKFQNRIGEKIRIAGYPQDAQTWIGKTMLASLLGALIGAILLGLVYPFVNGWLSALVKGVEFSLETAVPAGLILGLGMGIAFRCLALYYSIERRRAKVEEILPDFLFLVGGNIRAGMTSFSAFKSSTRPEFGPLSDEIKSVASRSLGTESFSSALSTVSERIQSRNLSETVRFFLQAMRSGGKMAQLLENTANDLRRTQDLKKELETSTKTYVIFIAFVMMVATPLLMAVSVQFVALITQIQAQNTIASTDSSSLGFLGGALQITPAFLESVAYVLLFGNAILAGIFMGTIGQGKPLLGLRYTPVLFAISLVAFFLAKGVLGGILATT